MSGRTVRLRKAAAVGAALAAFGVLGGGTASAATVVGPPVICSPGYVCVQGSLGSTVLVAAGQSRHFSPPLMVSAIVNLSGEGYCVSGDQSSSLPNGATEGSQILYGLTPAPAGTVCPA